MAEIQFAERLQTKKKAAQLSANYWNEFIRRSQENPKQLGNYLIQLQNNRNMSKRKLAMLLQLEEQKQLHGKHHLTQFIKLK